MNLIDITLRTYPAKAVKVTKENMAEVAEWCGGWVESRKTFEGPAIVYIAMPIRHSLRETTDCAFVGQWVVESDGKFTPYKHSRFMGKFAMREKDDLIKKRAKVVELVREAMSDHFVEGVGFLADETNDDITNRIMEIFA